jgi:hypothetical protein
MQPRSLPWVAAVLAVAAGAGACGSDDASAPHRKPALVSVARPTPPRHVRVPSPASVELRARNPDLDGRPRLYAAILTPPPGRPRDVCVATGIVGQDRAEADTGCDVAVPGSATAMIGLTSLPDRDGPSPTPIAGVAPAGVRDVVVDGPGGPRRLPLSAHRGFLVLYSARARGQVRLISRLRQGSREKSFRLPLPGERSYSPLHRHRRRGAVFNDEIGEAILSSTSRQVVRRFGPPAAERTEGGRRCAYYEVVGFADDGWRLCFAPSGSMFSADGRKPPPPD